MDPLSIACTTTQTLFELHPLRRHRAEGARVIAVTGCVQNGGTRSWAHGPAPEVGLESDGSGRRGLTRSQHHDGLAGDLQHALFIQLLEYPASHFTGTANNTGKFLTGNADLGAIGVAQGIRLMA